MWRGNRHVSRLTLNPAGPRSPQKLAPKGDHRSASRKYGLYGLLVSALPIAQQRRRLRALWAVRFSGFARSFRAMRCPFLTLSPKPLSRLLLPPIFWHRFQRFSSAFQRFFVQFQKILFARIDHRTVPAWPIFALCLQDPNLCR